MSIPCRTHHGDQQENQLAGKHITEQPHTQRHGFGQKLNHIQQQIEWRQRDPKWRAEQFMHKTTHAFNFKAIEQHQQQDAERHTDWTINICRWNDTGVWQRQMQRIDQPTRQIHRNQVQRIHQHNPEKHSQRQRRDKRTIAMHNRGGLLLNHFNQRFNGSLHAIRRIRSDFARYPQQKQQTDYTSQHRKENGIKVDV